MFIFQLMIAHFLGDFFLQPNRLIDAKYKNPIGTFIHAMIIAACSALALFPFWHHTEIWVAIGIIFIAHFIQDVIKVAYDKHYNPKNSPMPFFADQIGHLALIVFIGIYYGGLTPMSLPSIVNVFYFSEPFLLIVMGILLITYTFDITRYQFKHMRDKKLKFVPNYNRMVNRILAFSILSFVIAVLSRLLDLT